jgi:type II secretory pathway pseudopilin PulG
MRRVRALLARQSGYTLVELVVVMLTLGALLAGITTFFVQGSTAELDSNNRFQAQLNANLALSKLRKEAHCASSVTVTSSANVTLTQPSACTGGGGSISWCAVGSSSKYGLYRKSGTTCDATGALVADYLTSSAIFTYTAQSTSALAKLHVDLPVNINPSTRPADSYDLQDDIVLRNSTRS